MRLVYTSLDINILLGEKITSLYIEDKLLYRRLISELIDQNNSECGEWILSDDSESLSIKNNIFIVYDYFNMDQCSKPLNHKLQEILVNRVNEKIDILADINYKLQELYNETNIDLPIDIAYSQYIGAKEIIKLGAFHFSYDEYDIPNSLIGLLECSNEFLMPKINILIGLDAILANHERQEFYSTCFSKGIPLLAINSGRRIGGFDKKLENTYTIDKDLCLIY